MQAEQAAMQLTSRQAGCCACPVRHKQVQDMYDQCSTLRSGDISAEDMV